MSERDDHSSVEWRDLNHAWWEERAALHSTSLLYREGGSGLETFEWEDLGSVEGLNVVHPQCHIGTDTISLAERGASTVGIDFSASAIEIAPALAEQAGVGETEWLVGDVYNASQVVEGRTFDLVYTGKGAICWLPDMGRWAEVMWALCRPGGRFYLSEFHPLLDQLHDDNTTFARPYFPTGGDLFVEPGSYAAPDAVTTHNIIVDFIHPLSEVMQALLDVGFQLRAFREFPITVYQRWPWMLTEGDRVWRLPSDIPNFPMMYSLMFDKPE
ncbi:MAG: SAM-dependent methyltransferase [Candidatus Aldehydirespiratoraceae bacterium]|jgi:SAM-dependent methyltransferase